MDRKLVLLLIGLAAPAVFAQDQPPMFTSNSVAKSTKAINYRHRSGATMIDFVGTAVMPQAKGTAKVESKQGAISIEANFRNIGAPGQFGAEYLTYVLWAISPEGRPKNLGELLLDGGKSSLRVTTDLQVFALIVTAEPYFSVSEPSDVIIMENEVRPDTVGKIETVDAHYELLKRGQYQKLANVLQLTPDPKIPVEIYEARNAVNIAQSSGADKDAPDTFAKAKQDLQQAEEYLKRKQRKPAIMIAREAAQTAEDSRTIALKRQEERRQEAIQAAERAAKEKAAAEAAARAQADAERKAAEAQRAQAEAAQQKAEMEKMQAQLAAAKADAEKARADAARAEAAAEAQRAQQAAAEAQRQAQQAEMEKQQLRAQLLSQLNAVLATRDTDRGLVVTMADVLFDSGKYTLKPDAQLKLARLAGIILAHPGLKLTAEGYTDSTGSAAFNQKLSEKRADAVAEFLHEQGIPTDNLSSMGYGDARPIASNDTAAGRRQNRRVELIVSGEVIGTKIGAPPAAAGAAPAAPQTQQ
jgi:outer membrane protein OmpA-like peptidoglycan-associated protein